MLWVTIRSLASYLIFGILALPLVIPLTFLFMLPARYRYDNKLLFWLGDLFYRLVIKSIFIPVKVLGTENLPKEPAIFVANHQSSLDIPLLGMLVHGVPHVWLATNYLLKSPILRFVLPRMAVLVDMETPRTAMRSLLKIIALTNNHHRHIMIFPEGGRYIDGKVHAFLGGFSLLAKELNRPVVPVYIHNVNKVYPPHSFLIHNYPVTVVVGKPFLYTEEQDEKHFKQQVYQWFVDQQEESE